MGKVVTPPAGGEIENVNLKDALEERYLAYALSTIMHRALPDARDGLKPVHRRILHAMRLLRLDPKSAPKKCARVVGDVMGQYHPHGDQSIYDALVRMAQDFAQRYPLVEGQGNFGNIDGDNAAAMRYTEARLTEVARLLLEGIDEDAVDFRETYDQTNEEPVVLPAAFPNLLANGSQGIAVGMATSIPPHNAYELCDAALHLIKEPAATSDDLAQFVPGPDLPTGGIIVDNPASIAETYRTGRGSFRVRARWEKEDTGRGTWNIVITEIPYSVPKSRLIEKIAELLQDKKLPLLADVRDESAEDIRVVLEPRSRTVDPIILMESLFRLTELESRIPMNVNVLAGGKVPKVLSLAECLREWLDHRREVLVRRSTFRLAAIDKRLEILGGLLIVYLDLDRVIKIIREDDEPKAELMRFFKLTDMQANAILDTRLRSLRKLEEMELKREQKSLQDEKASIEDLLGLRQAAMEDGGVGDQGSPQGLRPRHRHRTPPHDLRRNPRHLRHRLRRGDGGARARHRDRVGEGLDPRAERPSGGPVQRAVQGRRQAQDVVLHRNHREDRRRDDERKVLHARGVETPRRARLRRSDPPHGRSGRGRRFHRGVPL